MKKFVLFSIFFLSPVVVFGQDMILNCYKFSNGGLTYFAITYSIMDSNNHANIVEVVIPASSLNDVNDASELESKSDNIAKVVKSKMSASPLVVSEVVALKSKTVNLQ